MWKCENAEMWKCGNVEMWKCENGKIFRFSFYHKIRLGPPAQGIFTFSHFHISTLA